MKKTREKDRGRYRASLRESKVRKEGKQRPFNYKQNEREKKKT